MSAGVLDEPQNAIEGATVIEGNNVINDVGPGIRIAETVEQEIKRKGLTAPRITPKDIEDSIACEAYFTAHEGVLGATEGWQVSGGKVDVTQALKLLTFCVLVLRNGYTVHGVSACASPENFNAELGQRIARENAVREIWPLMGYALKEQLHEVCRMASAAEPLVRVDER